jgi:hypothetical protein
VFSSAPGRPHLKSFFFELSECRRRKPAVIRHPSVETYPPFVA